ADAPSAIDPPLSTSPTLRTLEHTPPTPAWPGTPPTSRAPPPPASPGYSPDFAGERSPQEVARWVTSPIHCTTTWSPLMAITGPLVNCGSTRNCPQPSPRRLAR